MAELYHAVVKDHDNSGYACEAFFCKDCLNGWIIKHEDREALRRNLAPPKYISGCIPLRDRSEFFRTPPSGNSRFP